MSIEKQNDSRRAWESWKDRLDHLSFVPGLEPLDKDWIWEKLDQRLIKPIPLRKYAFYWIAAAGLLALVFFSVILSKHQRIDIAQKIKVNPSGPKTSEKDGPISNTPTGPSSKMKGIVYNIPRKIRFPLRTPTLRPAITATEDHSNHLMNLYPIIPELSPVDIASLSAIANKKIGAMVPLNESLPGANLNPFSESAPERYFFKIKVYNPANLFMPSVADEQSNNPILKIPLSGQN